MKTVGVLYAFALGLVLWLVSFTITTLIPTPVELYLFPGIIVGILNGFLIIVVMNFYVKKFKVKDWFVDTLIAGIIIATLNIILDYILLPFFPQSNITLMGYPLYIVFSIFGGYLTVRK
jgi:hypothetical protein